MTPVVSGDVLSFASCNVTKQSPGASGCYLYAFNTGSGAELWHMHTNASIMAAPTIMNGVVYAGTFDGTLYAVDARSGKQLWSASTGGAIGQVLSSAGVVYVEALSSAGQTARILAYDAVTHENRWPQNGNAAIFNMPGQPARLSSAIQTTPYHPLAALSGGPTPYPFVLDHGLIYVHSDPEDINVINASNGSIVRRYPVSNIYGFSVATP
jgi:hypothetical protein